MESYDKNLFKASSQTFFGHRSVSAYSESTFNTDYVIEIEYLLPIAILTSSSLRLLKYWPGNLLNMLQSLN